MRVKKVVKRGGRKRKKEGNRWKKWEKGGNRVEKVEGEGKK